MTILVDAAPNNIVAALNSMEELTEVSRKSLAVTNTSCTHNSYHIKYY